MVLLSLRDILESLRDIPETLGNILLSSQLALFSMDIPKNIPSTILVLATAFSALLEYITPLKC